MSTGACDGHLSLPAIASGAMPDALSFLTASRYASHVAGAAVIPASVKAFLLYQKPIMPMSHGTPYCLPLYE